MSYTKRYPEVCPQCRGSSYRLGSACSDCDGPGIVEMVPASKLDLMKMRKDNAYLERNRCVALAARMAVAMGLRVSVTKTAISGWAEDWHGCVYIELPSGQVSWHFHDSQASLFEGLPQRDESWDGHDTPEKYRRVGEAFQQSADSATDMENLK